MTEYRSTSDFTAKRVEILSNTQLITMKEFTNKDYISQFASEHYKTAQDNQDNSDNESDKGEVVQTTGQEDDETIIDVK